MLTSHLCNEGLVAIIKKKNLLHISPIRDSQHSFLQLTFEALLNLLGLKAQEGKWLSYTRPVELQKLFLF
jgi:hypothetical protein